MATEEIDIKAACRVAEALIFASPKPVPERVLAEHLPENVAIDDVLDALLAFYRQRGVALIKGKGGWSFSCAATLAHLPDKKVERPRALSRQALAVLAFVAMEQPITTADIDLRRGGKNGGILARLERYGWIKKELILQDHGAPIAWETTEAFLDRLGLESLNDLPTPDEARVIVQAREGIENPEEEASIGPFRWISAGMRRSE